MISLICFVVNSVLDESPSKMDELTWKMINNDNDDVVNNNDNSCMTKRY